MAGLAQGREGSSVFDLFLDAATPPELDHAVYGAYLRGLREAGWSGDERLVRLGGGTPGRPAWPGPPGGRDPTGPGV
ncbi:hypothetical protein FHR32_007399 [Streptosporangium album]|uniref:Uncharacterized protein n=1 Tax=Streptosporangium album TaxID=47479 RepID=A0A7W7S317_9ACTN|nr:hypothetical protein [Streptosporangium album]MBB4942999.1 hypothetical protein [Streptosporangium album]